MASVLAWIQASPSPEYPARSSSTRNFSARPLEHHQPSTATVDLPEPHQISELDTLVDMEEHEDIVHYDDISEVPDDIRKYWEQRHDIFSKYDEGAWLTHDAWFGITPEPVANQIAQHIAAAAPATATVLIDAFAGAGGNSIAFALSGRWDRIFAIEKDPAVLKCAKHNATVYGVANKIWWLEGDCFELIPKRLKAMGNEAVVFASPPWGGPGYTSSEVFDLSTMQPYSLRDLYTAFSKITKEVALYLPRTSDLNQIAKLAADGRKIQVTHYCMRGASKALCAYYGNFNWTNGENGAQENGGVPEAEG